MALQPTKTVPMEAEVQGVWVCHMPAYLCCRCCRFCILLYGTPMCECTLSTLLSMGHIPCVQYLANMGISTIRSCMYILGLAPF